MKPSQEQERFPLLTTAVSEGLANDDVFHKLLSHECVPDDVARVKREVSDIIFDQQWMPSMDLPLMFYYGEMRLGQASYRGISSSVRIVFLLAVMRDCMARKYVGRNFETVWKDVNETVGMLSNQRHLLTEVVLWLFQLMKIDSQSDETPIEDTYVFFCNAFICRLLLEKSNIADTIRHEFDIEISHKPVSDVLQLAGILSS